jgi:hypothetical protein
MKTSDGISPENMKEAMAFAHSDAGKKLYAHLEQTNGQQLRNAMDLASAGNYDGVKKAISSLLSDPETIKLLEKMGK